jgi:hypothetical protein
VAARAPRMYGPTKGVGGCDAKRDARVAERGGITGLGGAAAAKEMLPELNDTCRLPSALPGETSPGDTGCCTSPSLSLFAALHDA